MSVNVDTLNGILRFFRDDQETIDMVVNALEVFEDYHKAIYVLEITRRLYATGAIDADKYRHDTVERDRTRTINHSALLGQVTLLNRLAEEAGLPPFYEGTVSEERPYRREVANAVLAFVRQVIVDRR